VADRAIAIAIDGPASSGKGTVARGVARALGYAYVDTGAMYRSVALVAQQRGVPWDAHEALGVLAASLDFRFRWADGTLTVHVDGEDVSTAIRTHDIGTGASRVSKHPPVRDALLDLQRGLAKAGGVVMDGRDIGTVVLPDAELKVYLDASLDVRAQRRHGELCERGESPDLAAIRAAIASRDEADASRDVAPLKPADDAHIVDTTALDVDGAIAAVLALVRSCLDGIAAAEDRR
jgi:cytidylate kinase